MHDSPGSSIASDSDDFTVQTAVRVQIQAFPRIIQPAGPTTINGAPLVERHRLVDIGPSRRSSVENHPSVNSTQHNQRQAMAGRIPCPLHPRTAENDLLNPMIGDDWDSDSADERRYSQLTTRSVSSTMPLMAGRVGLGVYAHSHNTNDTEVHPLRSNPARYASVGQGLHSREQDANRGNIHPLRSHPIRLEGGDESFHSYTRNDSYEQRMTAQDPSSGRNKSLPGIPGSGRDNGETALRLPKSGMPLPSEIAENLRVSLSLFPEMMLLSDSLTVEMIRAFAKKLRRNVVSPKQKTASAWFFAKKDSTVLGIPKRMFSLRGKKDKDHDNKNAVPGRETAADAQPVWAPIKAIFPAGQDVLCDSLYAHIVAYNYIKTMCPDAAGTTTTLPSAAHPFQESSSANAGAAAQTSTRRATNSGSSVGHVSSASAARASSTVGYIPIGNGIDQGSQSGAFGYIPIANAAHSSSNVGFIRRSHTVSGARLDEVKTRQHDLPIVAPGSGRTPVHGVPDKAADMLGLSAMAAGVALVPPSVETTPPPVERRRFGTLRRRSAMAAMRLPRASSSDEKLDSGDGGRTEAASKDGKGKEKAGGIAMGDLQAALAQCIICLVADLGKSEAGSGPKYKGKQPARDQEPIRGLPDKTLLRALCEVVRYHEEVIPASSSSAV